MSFPCTKCGACCHVAGYIGFMPKREDGACVHLSADNTCEIYEDRPPECRVPDGPKRLHEATAAVCNVLQEYYQIDTAFRVVVE